MVNEAYFIRQRSLLHLPSKPVAFLIQVSCQNDKASSPFRMLNLPYTNVQSWASSIKDTYKQTICNNQCCQGIVWLCFYHKFVNLEIQVN